jgi:hypothetical protein
MDHSLGASTFILFHCILDLWQLINQLNKTMFSMVSNCPKIGCAVTTKKIGKLTTTIWVGSCLLYLFLRIAYIPIIQGWHHYMNVCISRDFSMSREVKWPNACWAQALHGWSFGALEDRNQNKFWQVNVAMEFHHFVGLYTGKLS